MTTNFPNSIDTDSELPPVSDNITEIGADAINSLRSAVFAVEQSLGINSQGAASSLADRVNVSINPDGTIKASALTSVGLLASPIRNAQVASDAAIIESKLNLDFSTASLASSINIISGELDTLNDFVQTTGAKVEPHIDGSGFNHNLSAIDIDAGELDRINLSIGQTIARNLTNAYGLVAGISIDLLDHSRADHLTNTTTPPKNLAHNAAGISINTSNFSFVPQTEDDLQKFAQYIDGSNLLILGTKYQTLYSNGIPRSSRSNSIPSNDGGQNLIPETPASTYLLSGGSSSPVDNIDNGDDCILLSPTPDNSFTAAFLQIRPGDIAIVKYGDITVSFPIKEKKFSSSGPPYLIRINGKNIRQTDSVNTATVKISRSLYNTDKQGVLALAQAPLPAAITGAYPSLTIAAPRGAEATSIGFNADLLDSTHYNLYLQLYPTGNPTDQSLTLAPVDVTGNLGITPGLYTLDGVVSALNKVFRAPGYNYRFIASSFKGELVIKLADCVNNVSFSIITGIVNSSGSYDQTLTNAAYSNMNNAINVFDGKDALGLGPSAANLASPPYSISYSSAAAAMVPTRIIAPVTKRTYYVNGAESERLATEPKQTLDGYGESFWEATIVDKTIIAGTRVKVVYQVDTDLSASSLFPGKTILVQDDGYGNAIDFGRFTIESVQFNDCHCDDGYYTQITVYDAIHTTGISPFVSTNIGSKVRLYFSSDTVSFSNQNVSDLSATSIFKRWFEIYIDATGKSFSYERARKKNTTSSLTVDSSIFNGDSETFNFDLVKVSPKLRGYKFGSSLKISLTISSYDATTGIIAGYLCYFDGTSESNKGPVTIGKKGNIVRFYDETYIDYIDIIVDGNAVVASFTNKRADIQLFRSFQLDKEFFLLGSCQVDDITKSIDHLQDGRDFGNTGEDQLTNSALNYISTPTQLLNENGIIRGFELTASPTNVSPYPNIYSISGGVAVINGKIVQINNQNIAIPLVYENINNSGTTNASIDWFLCLNEKAELELIANTNFISGNTLYENISVDHNRLFYVYNPAISSNSYVVRSSYLSNLVLNQRDVVPVGLISATVSNVSGVYVLSTSSYTDLRRHTTTGSGGMTEALVLGANSSFRTMNSLLGWLNQLINYKSSSAQDNMVGRKVIVKGDNIISTPYTLSFASKVNFCGGAFNITIPTGMNIGSNVSFENVRFNYVYDATSDGNFIAGNSVNASSSAIRVTTPGGTPGAPATIKNIDIVNCHFISPYTNHFAFFACNFTGESDRVENLVISGNRFDCTSTIDNVTYPGGDIQAAVAIYSSRIAAPISSTRISGQRLVNGLIENNICNKNQIISISGTSVSAANIFDSIVPVNVKIRNNVCGAINLCVKQDVPQTVFVSDSSQANLYRECSLTVSDNICIFIYTGDANGNYFQTLTPSVTTAFTISRFYTPPITISNNTVSYIQTGLKVPTTYTQNFGSITIKNNKMSPGIDTCLNPYTYIGYAATALPIYVDKGAF